MRSETLRKRLVMSLRSDNLGIVDAISVDLAKLHVAAKDEPKKKTLLP